MQPTLMVKCDCGGEAVEFNYDADWKMVEVSMWRRRADLPMSFKERFRWCWNILKTGNPWADWALLNEKDVQEVKKYFNQF